MRKVVGGWWLVKKQFLHQRPTTKKQPRSMSPQRTILPRFWQERLLRSRPRLGADALSSPTILHGAPTTFSAAHWSTQFAPYVPSPSTPGGPSDPGRRT